MAYERRTISGGVPDTELAAGIDGSTLTITIVDATGWPTGTAGDFAIVIDRGTDSEEKCLIDSRTTTTLTVASGGRGTDGTSAQSHLSGATIEHCLLARDLDEANAHIADTSLDHHTQYINNTRHDVEARHAFGAALGTPAAAADIGTTGAAGSGDNPAREDHVHQIGTGAIDTAAQFAAGVIDAAAIGTDAVTTAKILDDNVTAAKIADGAIDAAAKFGAGVVDSAALGADAVIAGKIADGAVDTTATLADAIITAAKFASEAPPTYVPTLTGVSLGGGGTKYGEYYKFGRLVVGLVGFTLGTGGNVTASIQISLPFTAGAASRGILAARGTHLSLRATGIGVVEPGEAVGKNIGTIGAGTWDNAIPWDWDDGDTLVGVFFYTAVS